MRNHLVEAMRKLDATNRTAAARLARDRGWIRPAAVTTGTWVTIVIPSR